MDTEIKIAGLTGSLRKGSYNMAALRASKDLLPEGASLTILDLSHLPFYNEDVDRAGIVPAVAEFKAALAASDALLIATPEYNYSVPPVLKNALDWASRSKPMPLFGKPAAIMSASPGLLGGVRAQYHLRQVCVALNLMPLNRPEVCIVKAAEKFDASGNLTDEFIRKAIKDLLQSLVDTARGIKNK